MQRAINSKDDRFEVTRVAGNQAVNVWYDVYQDTVALQVGATTIHMATTHFFAMHEMMRKAAARLVMQTTLESNAANNKLKIV